MMGVKTAGSSEHSVEMRAEELGSRQSSADQFLPEDQDYGQIN